jgi:competence protein ComFC
MKWDFRKSNPLPMINLRVDFVREYAETLLELLYPLGMTCTICGQVNEDSRFAQLCARCFDRMVIIRKPICLRCGRPLRLEGYDHCPECSGLGSFFISYLRTVGLYRGYLREVILAFKYRGRPELAEPLGELLAARFISESVLSSVDALIPIPLHAERYLLRGYNQAELLAKRVGCSCRLPVLTQVLQRNRVTQVQNRLTRHERLTNVKGAFHVGLPGAIRGKSLLLIDDILTTGFTVNECARTLLAAGAKMVCALTLAVGVLQEQWSEEELE